LIYVGKKGASNADKASPNAKHTNSNAKNISNVHDQ
jgi:hypothetical protein